MRKILPILLALALASCGRGGSRYVQINGYAQGGTYTVKVNMAGVELPASALKDSVEALLLQIDTTLSGYNKRSLLSRFNAGDPVPATPLFLDMYREAYRWWQKSGGALDFAAGPLYDAWGFGFRNKNFPSAAQVDSLKGLCGMSHLPSELSVKDGIVDPSALGFPRLNYNAIAQGFSCDIIARYLYGLGIKDMLVDIGEIWCDGLNPSGKPWAVGIDRPVDQPAGAEAGSEGLSGIWSSSGKPAGIVTSGNYRKFYIKDGKKYAHTIDPRSGYPVQHNLLSATVVSAQSAATADAVATWCMVVGLEEAQKLLLEDPSLEGCLITALPDGTLSEWTTPGFTLQQ
ncbi:MAG: FAD:protein FMN transferase [Bacteroidales bacterium]|nr:FAD:protein FMN transferase [Bacteroidales bacterium]